MAFEKPVIVVGAGGLSDIFAPDTAEQFFYGGIYGKEMPSRNNEKHSIDLRTLVVDAALRQELGQYSRQFVVENFSLEVVADKLHSMFVSLVTERPTSRFALLRDVVRTEFIRNLGPYIPSAVKRTFAKLD